MFESLGKLGGLGGLMRQAQEMGGRMQEVNDKLKLQKVTATAGGGMVEVEMNGLGQMLRLVIEPELMEKNEREMLEDLIPAAVNEAIRKSKELHVAEMKTLTQGINVPGLDAAIEKFTGTS
jgi:DNA-binding YbaB/EbfC family protein